MPREERNLLHMVPQRRDVRFGYEGGRVVFEVPRFRSAVGNLFRRVVRVSEFLNVTLDEVGTFIWDQIDGRRTVEEIGKNLSARFGERVEPLYPKLAEFLGLLERDEFIRYGAGAHPRRR